MNIKYAIASLVLLLPLAGNAEPPPSTSSSDTASPLHKLEEGVVKFELSNGLRVVMYRRPQAPVFAAQIWVRVGGVDEVPGSTGIAHMLEHMAFKGTETIGTKDYSNERGLLARYEELIGPDGAPKKGAAEEIKQLESQLRELWIDNEFSRMYNSMGGVGLNAGTAKDFTFYTVSLPSVAFDLWCWLESDRLLHPVFRQFYQEREVVLEERRSRYDDNPDGLLYEALVSTAFTSHPNRLPVIGWPSDLRRLTATAIADFYRTYYRPDNMVLVLVGDLDPAQAKPMLERYFGRLVKPDAVLPTVATVEEPQRGEKTVVVEFDAQPTILMGYHKPTYPNMDDVAFTVLHEVLAGTRSSIFERELLQQKQLVSSIYTSEAPGTRYPPIFYVGATPNKGVSYARVRDEIQRVFERIAHDGVSAEALQGARRRAQVQMLDHLSSNSGLVYALATNELFWNDWRVMITFYDQLLNVTNEDIKRIASQYLVRSNRTIAMLEKPGARESALEKN